MSIEKVLQQTTQATKKIGKEGAQLASGIAKKFNKKLEAKIDAKKLLKEMELKSLSAQAAIEKKYTQKPVIPHEPVQKIAKPVTSISEDLIPSDKNFTYFLEEGKIKGGLTTEQAKRGAKELMAATGRKNYYKSAEKSAKAMEEAGLFRKMDLKEKYGKQSAELKAEKLKKELAEADARDMVKAINEGKMFDV